MSEAELALLALALGFLIYSALRSRRDGGENPA